MLTGRSRQFVATLDYWDDRRDVYRVLLRRGQRVSVGVRGRAGTPTDLSLWKPGTRTLSSRRARRLRLAHSARPGSVQRISYKARAGGWYYVGVTIAKTGAGSYRLSLSKG